MELSKIKISSELQQNLHKGYVNFIVGMFISGYKHGDLSDEKKIWFIQEIYEAIINGWPDLTKEQAQDILQNIVDMAAAAAERAA